jgi:hypothetical protein
MEKKEFVFRGVKIYYTSYNVTDLFDIKKFNNEELREKMKELTCQTRTREASRNSNKIFRALMKKAVHAIVEEDDYFVLPLNKFGNIKVKNRPFVNGLLKQRFDWNTFNKRYRVLLNYYPGRHQYIVRLPRTYRRRMRDMIVEGKRYIE